jgi:hypothetical protein
MGSPKDLETGGAGAVWVRRDRDLAALARKLPPPLRGGREGLGGRAGMS